MRELISRTNKKKKVKLFIRAEDMPGSCNECFFGERYGCVGDVECHALREYFTGNVKPPYKERPDECPLLELTEKRGVWETVFHFSPFQRCSVCGFEMPMTASESMAEIRMYRYCPDCGARMDGGDGRENKQETEVVAATQALAD